MIKTRQMKKPIQCLVVLLWYEASAISLSICLQNVSHWYAFKEISLPEVETLSQSANMFSLSAILNSQRDFRNVPSWGYQQIHKRPITGRRPTKRGYMLTNISGDDHILSRMTFYMWPKLCPQSVFKDRAAIKAYFYSCMM